MSKKKDDDFTLADDLLSKLVGRIDSEFRMSTPEDAEPVEEWLRGIDLGGSEFSFDGHAYQREWFTDPSPRRCHIKGAQVGASATVLLRTMHGLLNGKYKQGGLILFPTREDVADFSRSRLAPLISENQKIASRVRDTDSVHIKRIGSSYLYLRGARATSTLGGVKASSSALKSIPADVCVFDECDEFSEGMISLARERLSHSSVAEEVYLSTPSIPGYGIDAIFQKSDQRYWEIKCSHCGKYTCLEREFPRCVKQTPDGAWYRACTHCSGEIYPADGQWVATYPERAKDMVGWRISQLNSIFVPVGRIMEMFLDPPGGNLAEVYNSKLALPYISADNLLNVNDVLACCGHDLMASSYRGDCGMGVDVGRELHVVIASRPADKKMRVVWIGKVGSFEDLHQLVTKFRVKCVVVDKEPETRAARAFQAEAACPVYLCDYASHAGRVATRVDDQEGLIVVGRTETLDRAHHIVTSPGRLTIPRQSEIVLEFARGMCAVAKTLEEDPVSGSRKFIYKKLGEDHYRHAFGYCMLALESNQIGVTAQELDPMQEAMGLLHKRAEEEFDPLTYGLKHKRRPW